MSFSERNFAGVASDAKTPSLPWPSVECHGGTGCRFATRPRSDLHHVTFTSISWPGKPADLLFRYSGRLWPIAHQPGGPPLKIVHRLFPQQPGLPSLLGVVDDAPVHLIEGRVVFDPPARLRSHAHPPSRTARRSISPTWSTDQRECPACLSLAKISVPQHFCPT